MVNAFSFWCSACGKCCNSPPAMSLRELFRQRELFGCIAISRVTRLPVGDTLQRNKIHGLQRARHRPLLPARRPVRRLLVNHGARVRLSIGRPLSRARQRGFVQHSCKWQAGHVRCRATRSSPARLPHSSGCSKDRALGAGYIGADCIVSGSHANAALLVAEGRIGYLRARPSNDGGRLSPPNGNYGVAR